MWLYGSTFGRFASIWSLETLQIYHLCFTSQSSCFHFLSGWSNGGSVLGANLLINLLCWEVNQGLQSVKFTISYFFPDTVIQLSSLLMTHPNSVVENTNETTANLNQNFENINKWAQQWKMSFNPGPTKMAQEVLFSRKRSKAIHPSSFLMEKMLVVLNLTNISVLRLILF